MPSTADLHQNLLLGQQGHSNASESLVRRATECPIPSKPMMDVGNDQLHKRCSAPAVIQRDTDFIEHHVISRLARRLTVSMVAQEGADELQTNGEAFMNLVNNGLGSGLLSTAFAVSQAGLLVSLGCIVMFMFVNRFTVLLNLKSCQLARCDPGTCAIGEETFGTCGRLFMTLLFVSQSYLVMVSYCDACADSVKGIVAMLIPADDLPTERTIMIASWLVLLVPVTFVRSMKSIGKLSFIAFLGGVGLVIGIVACCAVTVETDGLNFADVDMVPQDRSKFLGGLSIFIFLFAIQPGSAAVLATMKDTSDANVRKVSLQAFLVIAAMNIVLGSTCYITLGSKTKGDILLSFPSSLAAAVAARFSMLILVVLSYMIVSIPCKIPMIDLLFHKNEALQESSAVQFYGFTVVLNVLVIILALGVSDLSVILGANGAVCSTIVGLILPPMFYLKIRASPTSNDDQPVPFLSAQNAPYFLLMFVGVFALIVCTAQAMH